MKNRKKEGELSSIYDFTIKFIEAVYYHTGYTNMNNVLLILFHIIKLRQKYI